MASSVFHVRAYYDFDPRAADQVIEQARARTKNAINVIEVAFDPRTQLFRVCGDYFSAEVFALELIDQCAEEIKLARQIQAQDKSAPKFIREGNFAVWNHEEVPWTTDLSVYKSITGSVPLPVRDRSRYSLAFEWHPKKSTDFPRMIQQMGADIKGLEDEEDCMIDIEIDSKRIILKAYSSDAIDATKEKIDLMQDSYNREWKNRDLHVVIPIVKSSFHLQFVPFSKQNNMKETTMYSKMQSDAEKLFSIRLLEYNPAKEKFVNRKVEVKPVYLAPSGDEPSPPWPPREFREWGTEPCPPLTEDQRMAIKLRAALSMVPIEPDFSKPETPVPQKTARKARVKPGKGAVEGNLIDISTDTDHPIEAFARMDLKGSNGARLDAKSTQQSPFTNVSSNQGIWGASTSGTNTGKPNSTWSMPAAPPPASSTTSSISGGARWGNSTSNLASNTSQPPPPAPTNARSGLPIGTSSRPTFSLGARPTFETTEPERLDTPGPPGGVALPTRKVRIKKPVIKNDNEYHDISRQQQRRFRRDEDTLEDIMEHNRKEITRNLRGGLTRAKKHKGFLSLKIEFGRVIFDGLPKNVSKGDFPWGELENTLDSIRNTYTTKFVAKLTKNYYDIEFIAGIKLGKGQPMFSKSLSERLTFEFNCTMGEKKMVIVFDADSGIAEVRGRTIDYCSTYMSYPTQNWDARISVEGYSFFDKHEEPFRSFIKKLYIPAGKTPSITYQMVPGLEVVSIFARREARHLFSNTYIGGEMDMALVEHQVLCTEQHTTMRHIFRASPFQDPHHVAEHSLTWYTAALFPIPENRLLHDKGIMVVGEPLWTAAEILGNNDSGKEFSERAISAASVILERIDGVGADRAQA